MPYKYSVGCGDCKKKLQSPYSFGTEIDSIVSVIIKQNKYGKINL